MRPVSIFSLLLAGTMLAGCGGGDNGGGGSNSLNGKLRPACEKVDSGRTSDQLPQTVASDWGAPVKLSASINTLCPEDAIEISADGQRLYFMYTEDLLSVLGEEQLHFPNGTYVAENTGDPAQFGEARYVDLRSDTGLSLDGELSFTRDENTVYFHSNRPENTGYALSEDDYLDIYRADMSGKKPADIENLGSPVNSRYLDGEHALHLDDQTLYFTSTRPGDGAYTGGPGKGNIWRSTWDGANWSAPEMLSGTINKSDSEQKQPAFTADGKTMYFVSDHDGAVGTAIYRSTIDGSGNFSTPELVIKGGVGEPSLTADGRYLYFVHVEVDGSGLFDADVWYVEKAP